MKTGIVTTDTYLNHDTGQGHPERADRVTAIINHLSKLKSKNNYNQLTSSYMNMDAESYNNIKISDIEKSIYLAKNC